MESEARSEPVDYPVAEQMPDSRTHSKTRRELEEGATRHLASRGVRAFASSDQFVYWVKGEPTISAAPDVYVVLGADPELLPKIWKTWERGVPDLVIEVVSGQRPKDYSGAPQKYGEMGVQELIVFDPQESRGRVRWQLFRRIDGGLLRVEAHDGDRVWSSILQAWLVLARHADGTATARVATGTLGEHLVPIDRELAEARGQALEAKDAELEAKDAELEAKDAELERLRALLAERPTDP